MTPPEDPKPVVACMVTGEWASRSASHAVSQEGGQLAHLSAADLASTRGQGFSALIYDLAPWDDRSLVGINRLRRSCPDMPLLFYVPPVSRAVALIPRCGGIPNVRIRMQERNGSGVSEFHRDVRWLVQAVPGWEIMARLSGVLREMPSAFGEMAEYVLRTLAARRRPSVESAARALKLSKRTLERRVREKGMPAPKELIDWITLLHVSFMAARTSLSLSKAARRAGINPNDLYRTKKRLAERSRHPIPGVSEDWFTEVVAAFATRCHVLDPSIQRSIPFSHHRAGPRAGGAARRGRRRVIAPGG